ncbi:MAG TPA: ABC transporter ATP-binding protein, partial [Chloroflexaceae bacterium]|nr:ABC transporter ATP-binding protein [Chloroflexaceae bacterium]
MQNVELNLQNPGRRARRGLRPLLERFAPALRSSRTVSWGRLLRYLRPYRRWMAAAILAMIGATGVGLLLPLAVGQMVNALVADGAAFALDQVVLALLGVVALQGLFSLVQSYALSFVGERVVSDLRVEAYSHLQRLSLGFFADRRTGEITSRITNDVTLIQTTVTSNVASLLQAIIQFVGALALMIAVSWQLSGMALLVVPAVTLLGMVFGRLLRRVSTEVQDRLADASSVLEETVAGVRVVQSFAREPYEVGRFRAAVEATFATALRRARIRAVFQPLWVICAWGAMVGVLWFGGRLVLAGELLAGDLVAFLFYAASIGGTMMTFSSLFGQLQEALGAVTRVFELLDTAPEIQDRPGAVALPTLAGRITFDHVTFAYGGEQEHPVGMSSALGEGAEHAPAAAPPAVIRDLSLEVAPGEILALVGPSGAGKSTIANLIPRFFDVRAGAVRVDGHDVRDVTLASLRGQIGIVPQETLLFSGSVGENIAYGRLGASQAAIEAAAPAPNPHDFVVPLPPGDPTALGERGVKLSGGPRPRAATA